MLDALFCIYVKLQKTYLNVTKLIIFSLYWNHPCHFLFGLKIEKATGICDRGSCSLSKIKESKTQAQAWVRRQGNLGRKFEESQVTVCLHPAQLFSPRGKSQSNWIHPHIDVHAVNISFEFWCMCADMTQNEKPDCCTMWGIKLAPQIPAWPCQCPDASETGAKLSLHVTQTEAEPQRAQTAMTLKRSQTRSPHKIILMKSLFRMTYTWQSGRRQAAGAGEEQWYCWLTKSWPLYPLSTYRACLAIDSWLYNSYSYITFHHTKNFALRGKGKQMNICSSKNLEHLWTQSFKNPPEKGAPCDHSSMSLWGLSLSNVHGIAIISHIISGQVLYNYKGRGKAKKPRIYL